MRAAVLTEVNQPLEILDLEQEPPKANEVRVQVKAAGVCMSDWPTGLYWRRPAEAFLRSGSAWLGRSQKDGLPSCRGGTCVTVQGHQLAHREGVAWSLPLSNREREWTPRRATLLCSPPCRFLRTRRLDFGLPNFGFGLFCVRCSWDFRRSREALARTVDTQKEKTAGCRLEAGLKE